MSGAGAGAQGGGWAAVLAEGAEGAAGRLPARRPAHLDLLRAMAARGDLLLGMPRLDGAGAWRGSAMIVREAALAGYLAAEPFRALWARQEVHPFRPAPLPYRPRPVSGEAPASPTHGLVVARDGQDSGAAARRAAARAAHLARVSPLAEAGVLTLGGALLDGAGAMVGSLAVTAHATLEEARRFWDEDPYVTEGVWREVARSRTRLAPLPYPPWPW